MIKPHYYKPDMTLLESRLLMSLLSGSSWDGEGIEDIVVEDPVLF